jgi:tripartite ATP-independent transporter DctM subunit
MNILHFESSAAPHASSWLEGCARTGSRVAGAENVLLAMVLATMVTLPLAEVVLRFFSTGIESVTTMVQHLTLAVASIGAAIAARENRLLSFSAAQILSGRAAEMARLVSYALSAAVCAILFIASVRFVEVERSAGSILAYGIPTWVFELVQPIGFGLITVRLLRHAAIGMTGSAVATLVASVIVAVAATAPVEPATLVAPALVALLIATLLGAPIFVAVGGAALILLWGEEVPIASLAVDHYALVVNPSLPTIPMFTLAGFFLAESGAPGRLLAVFDALFGRLRGGAAVVTVLAATFFTSFTGASGVTILALGGLMMPLLLRAGYRDASALALVTAGGSAGVLLMPALPLILYAIVAQIELEQIFLGGVLPAALMVMLVAIWGILQQPARPNAAPFDRHKARAALWAAKWELALPLVPIGALFSGFATPVEAAALTALYAFIVTTCLHRDLKLTSDVPRVMTECGLVVGGILLILGVALGLTNYLVDAQMTDKLITLITESIESPWVFLLALNGVLLFVGCFMDIFSAIVILVPLIVPLGQAFGINPVHLGLVFLANLELGYLTPPVGMNLFFAATRFKKPVLEVYRAVVPLFLLLCLGVLLITYVPFLSTALPGLLR